MEGGAVSAHCEKCGCDLVYPPGTWPLGECPVCAKAAEIDCLLVDNARLHTEVERVWAERDEWRALAEMAADPERWDEFLNTYPKRANATKTLAGVPLDKLYGAVKR